MCLKCALGYVCILIKHILPPLCVLNLHNCIGLRIFFCFLCSSTQHTLHVHLTHRSPCWAALHGMHPDTPRVTAPRMTSTPYFSQHSFSEHLWTWFFMDLKPLWSTSPRLGRLVVEFLHPWCPQFFQVSFQNICTSWHSQHDKRIFISLILLIAC